MSCGGNLLVNIGPDSAGQIAPVFQERLQQLGAWLAWHGEAIYSSQPWAAQQDSANKQVGEEYLVLWADKSGTNILCYVCSTGVVHGGEAGPQPGGHHRVRHPAGLAILTGACISLLDARSALHPLPGVGAGQPGGRPPHPGAAAGRGGAPALGGAAGWGTAGLPPPHQTRPRPCLGYQV